MSKTKYRKCDLDEDSIESEEEIKTKRLKKRKRIESSDDEQIETNEKSDEEQTETDEEQSPKKKRKAKIEFLEPGESDNESNFSIDKDSREIESPDNSDYEVYDPLIYDDEFNQNEDNIVIGHDIDKISNCASTQDSPINSQDSPNSSYHYDPNNSLISVDYEYEDCIFFKENTKKNGVEMLPESNEKAINELYDLSNKINEINNDPECYIDNYFGELTRQVDLDREKIIGQAHLESEKRIELINLKKVEFLKNIPERKRSGDNKFNEIENLKNLDAFNEINQEDFNKKLVKIKDELTHNLHELKSYVTNNIKVEYKESIFDIHKNVSRLYGTLSVDRQIIDYSKIINKNATNDLIKICSLNDNQGLKLIYRASRDGFSSKNFHDLCDNMGPTVTIIKTSENHIFGGFTKRNWLPCKNPPFWKQDSLAYIFSLVNDLNIPFKLYCTSPKNGILSRVDLGPCFGNDICINSSSNLNNKSYIDLFNKYNKFRIDSALDYDKLRDRSNHGSNGGSNHFKVDDIETFVIHTINEV